MKMITPTYCSFSPIVLVKVSGYISSILCYVLAAELAKYGTKHTQGSLNRIQLPSVSVHVCPRCKQLLRVFFNDTISS